MIIIDLPFYLFFLIFITILTAGIVIGIGICIFFVTKWEKFLT